MCDLGCGDGDFLVGLLSHLNASSSSSSLTTVYGVGIDYDTELISAAGIRSGSAGEIVEWIVYDFNEDQNDLANQLITTYNITHVFIYLLPKQLALQTVQRLLTRLCERLAKSSKQVALVWRLIVIFSGVTVCCHKFQPKYLSATKHDTLMDLAVYSNSSGMD